jgi:hypothetical protein
VLRLAVVEEARRGHTHLVKRCRAGIQLQIPCLPLQSGKPHPQVTMQEPKTSQHCRVAVH